MRVFTYRRRLIALWDSVAFRAIVLATLINLGLAVAIYVPHHSTHEEVASLAKVHAIGSAASLESPEERTADYTFWLTAYTFILAVSTVGLWFVTWRAARRQSRDMQASIRHAEAASQAAAESNALTAKALAAEHRPWIHVEWKIASPLRWDVNGFSFTVEFTLTNFGKVPATDLRPCCIGIAHKDHDIEADRKQKEFADRVRAGSRISWGAVTFPNYASIQEMPVHVEVSETLPSGHTFLSVVGCADYKSAGTKQSHQTGFAFRVWPRWNSTDLTLSRNKGDVPIELLQVSEYPRACFID